MSKEAEGRRRAGEKEKLKNCRERRRRRRRERKKYNGIPCFGIFHVHVFKACIIYCIQCTLFVGRF